MRAAIAAVVLGLSMPSVQAADLSAREANRIQEAATVLQEIQGVPDRSIPKDLWDRAACVLVVPSLKKGALIIGGEYGKGLMSCRHDGEWTAPIFMQIGKGSWGLQLGVQSIDLVLLVMNTSGAEKMLRNKVSLGAEASIAGGPVGRDARAATDAQMKAEILSVLAHTGTVCWHQPLGRRGAGRCRRQHRSVREEHRAARRRDDGKGGSAGRHRRVHDRAQAIANAYTPFSQRMIHRMAAPGDDESPDRGRGSPHGL